MTSTYLSPAREDLAHRLPKGAQSFVTWLSGIRGSRDPAARPLSPVEVVGIGVASVFFGFALIGLALSLGGIGGGLVYMLGFCFVSGGMRRLDVLVVHQTLHYKVLKTPFANHVLGEVLTVLLLRTPFRENQKSHLMHHRAPCFEDDADVLFLRNAGLGLEESRGRLCRRIVLICLSPTFHVRFLAERLRANFIDARPLYRLALSWAYLGALAMPGIFLGSAYYLALGLFWLLPLTIGFQISNFLYTASKHRWWAFSNQAIRDRGKKDVLSFTRVCCCKAPERNTPVAWVLWWMRAVSIHMPARLFVVVGDTVHHDLHHIAPNCDWPNSSAERPGYVGRTPDRFSEVWGGLPAHLSECNLRENSFRATARTVTA